jgi:Family of unknown function (DUF6812)
VTSRDDRTKVVILTEHYRITGEIALASGARLTDYLAEAAKFFAVVNAEVTDHLGREILSSSFLNVNREHVEVIVPADVVHMP